MINGTEQDTPAVMQAIKHPIWCTASRDTCEAPPESDFEHRSNELHAHSPHFDYEVSVALVGRYDETDLQLPGPTEIAVTSAAHGTIDEPVTAYLSVDGARLLRDALDSLLRLADLDMR